MRPAGPGTGPARGLRWGREFLIIKSENSSPKSEKRAIMLLSGIPKICNKNRDKSARSRGRERAFFEGTKNDKQKRTV